VLYEKERTYTTGYLVIKLAGLLYTTSYLSL